MSIDIGELVIEIQLQPDDATPPPPSSPSRDVQDARLIERITTRVLELLRDEQERWT